MMQADLPVQMPTPAVPRETPRPDAQVFVRYGLDSDPHLVCTIAGDKYRDNIDLTEQIDQKLRELRASATSDASKPRRVDAWSKSADCFDRSVILATVRVDCEGRYHRHFSIAGRLYSHRISRDRLTELVREMAAAPFAKGALNHTCIPLTRGDVLAKLRQRSIYLRKGGPELEELEGVTVWKSDPDRPLIFPTGCSERFARIGAEIKAMDGSLTYRQVAKRTGYPCETVRFVFEQIGR